MSSFRSVLLSLILFNQLIIPQNTAPFSTPDNIIRFADFLFCSEDYLRASIEYERFLNIIDNDTIRFKAALGYSFSGNFDKAKELLLKIPGSSTFHNSAQLEYYKTLLLNEEYDELSDIPDFQINNPSLFKIKYAAILLKGNRFSEEEKFKYHFRDEIEMLDIYKRKIAPETKSPLLAGILSAVIPGSGKIYTGRSVDGIFSFLACAVLQFLTYDNFQAGHNTRGWIFAGLGTLFYAGNIYGSAVSASAFNMGIMEALDIELKNTLEQKNYFILPYDLCK